MKIINQIIGVIMAIGAVIQMSFGNPEASGLFWIAASIFYVNSQNKKENG